jgi:hypothetical protein
MSKEGKAISGPLGARQLNIGTEGFAGQEVEISE